MKLLFVHDTKFKQDENGTYYTGGSYNEKIWSRYLNICSDLSVIARKDQNIYEIDYARDKFNYFDNQKINFIETPNINSSVKNLTSFKVRKNINEIILREVLINDFVIARLPSNNGSIAVKYAKKYNKPYLVEVVGCAWDALWNYSRKGKLLAPFNFIKQKKAVKDAKYAIYVTKNFLQERYPSKGESINCSNVFLNELNESIVKNRMEKIEKVKPNSKLIIGTTAAVNVKYKGQESIIKVLGRLKSKGIINFEYQLVGGGDQTYLKLLAEKYQVTNQVKFLGSLPYDEVINWLDSIDIYVQPSKTEGLPRALIEAMSRGLLSIGTNVGGIPELLDQNYIFSNLSNNEDEIIEILLRINKEELKKEAIRNFDVAKEYEQSKIESRRQLFFRKFISQK